MSSSRILAEIAQMVEHITRNDGVEGSSPFFSLNKKAFLQVQPRETLFLIFYPAIVIKFLLQSQP